MGNNPSMYIVPPVQFDLKDVVDDIVDEMVGGYIENIKEIVKQGTPIQNIKVLIPNHYGDSIDENGNVVGHWAATVIRKDKSGAVTLYYNDPAGNPYNPNPKTLLEKIIGLVMVLLVVYLLLKIL